MGTYGLQGVIRAWELGKITTEQAIGQILLLLVALEERLREIEQQMEWLRRRPHTGSPETDH